MLSGTYAVNLRRKALFDSILHELKASSSGSENSMINNNIIYLITLKYRSNRAGNLMLQTYRNRQPVIVK